VAVAALMPKPMADTRAASMPSSRADVGFWTVARIERPREVRDSSR
jgi:hypothetical protein